MNAIYDWIGAGYARQRRPDPRWQGVVQASLGTARTVINIAAGTGSYEPTDRYVLAVEPSGAMIQQRSSSAPPAIQAVAEQLPVADAQFGVAMAMVTVHHWQDWAAGLREMRRVADRAVVLHFDPAMHGEFWLARDYLPELRDVWRAVPSVEDVTAALGSGAVVHELPVPADCVDGFPPAYWRRPEAYLDLAVQQSMSGLQLLDPHVLASRLANLRSDLRDGAWGRRNADLLELDSLDVGWRLIVSADRPPR